MKKARLKSNLNYWNIFLCLLVGILLSSCASMSTMQTARTTEKGKVGFGFGGGSVNADIKLSDSLSIPISAPFMEVSGRYGATENLDFGAKLTLIGTAVIDGKYQFLGDAESKLAGSAGLGFGYLSISSGSTGNESESKIYDIMVPAYFSLHPAPWFALYTSPKYVLRAISYTSTYTIGTTPTTTKGSGTSHWYGVTTGLRIGKKVGFLAEYSYFGNSASSVPFTQFTAGLSFGIR